MATGTCATEGGLIHYEVDGSGPPILMIHAGVANLRMWDDQVAALRDRFRIIRYDTRGFGLTVSEHVEFSNRTDALAVLDAVGEASAHVVGLSRGGQIALDIALAHPDRVRSLTVAAGGIGGFDPGVEGDVDWDEVEAWEEAKDWDRLVAFETAYWFDGPGQPADRVDPEVRARVAGWIGDNYRAEPEYGIPRPLDPPAADRLTELAAPLLVIVGELDDAATVASMEHLAHAVLTAKRVSFPTAHLVNLEQPERFSATIAEFVRSVEASPADEGPPAPSPA